MYTYMANKCNQTTKVRINTSGTLEVGKVAIIALHIKIISIFCIFLKVPTIELGSMNIIRIILF